jgi:hypothetical protein
VIRFLLVMATLIGACSDCASAGTSTPECVAPRSVDEVCVMPSVARCLNTDAGLGACERTADSTCGLAAGVSAQVWTSVEAAEVTQGFVPKGH